MAKGENTDRGKCLVPDSMKLIEFLFLYQCLDYLFEIGVKMKLAGIPTDLNNSVE